MPIVPTGSYLDPNMGKITGNLALALFGDPEARAKAQLYGSEIGRNNALTGKTNAETGILTTKGAAYNDLPATLTNLYATGPVGETPDQKAARVAPYLAGILQAGGGYANELAGGLSGGLSSLYATGNDEDMRRSLVMNGKMPGKDFAGTAARADAVAGRDNAAEQQKSYGVARINQAGETARNSTNEAGRNTRFYDTPITAAPGNEIYLSPTDPRRKGGMGGPAGVITGQSTKNTVEGKAGDRLLAGEKSPTLDTLYTGKAGSTNGAKPKNVSAAQLNGAVIAGARGINGAVDLSNPNKPMLSPDFEASFDPERVSAARRAASDELSRSGNVDRAGQAYRDALGVKPGDTFNNPGAMSRLFGATKGVTPAAPVAAAPVVSAAPPNIPPPEARPVGTKATGRDGVPRMWDGRAWVVEPRTY